jgi:hypothetical protein
VDLRAGLDTDVRRKIFCILGIEPRSLTKLSKCEVISVHSFDFDKKKIVAEVRVPEAHFDGHYEVKGKLMALPITGKGPLDSTFCKSLR